MLPFDTTNTNNKISNIQKEFNTNKIYVHHGLGAMCQLEIKFKDKLNLMVVDILHIIHQLGITKRMNKVLVDIEAVDIHHKTSCIRFKMVEF